MKKTIFTVCLMSVALFMYSTANAGTIGFWTFDNINYGNQAGQDAGFDDSSASGLRGSLGTPFSSVNSTGGVSGAAGDNALSLDGEGSLFADDSANGLLNIQPPITLEAWVRSDVEQSSASFVAYGIPGGRSGGGGWKLGVRNGNILFTSFAVVDAESTVPFPYDGEWHHVAASYSLEQGIILYFLDGEEVDVKEENRPFVESGALDVNIGVQFNAITRFQGDIDRVRVSNVFLEADGLDSDSANIKPLDENVLAFWDFDEGEPPFTSEGAEPALTAISSAEWALTNVPRNTVGRPTVEENSPADVAGDFSLFFEFDGGMQSFVGDPNGVLDFGAGDDWTLEAWVSTDLALEGREVLFYYGRTGKGYSLSINTDGRLQVTTLGIADLASSNANVPNNFEWTHVAVAHKAGESMSYFINGALIETNAYTGGTNSADGGFLYIAGEWDGALPFTGNIDRIRISNSALSAGELDADGSSIATPVGVSNWSLY